MFFVAKDHGHDNQIQHMSFQRGAPVDEGGAPKLMIFCYICFYHNAKYGKKANQDE
jgi:hypothetical protein